MTVKTSTTKTVKKLRHPTKNKDRVSNHEKSRIPKNTAVIEFNFYKKPIPIKPAKTK